MTKVQYNSKIKILSTQAHRNQTYIKPPIFPLQNPLTRYSSNQLDSELRTQNPNHHRHGSSRTIDRTNPRSIKLLRRHRSSSYHLETLRWNSPFRFISSLSNSSTHWSFHSFSRFSLSSVRITIILFFLIIAFLLLDFSFFFCCCWLNV